MGSPVFKTGGATLDVTRWVRLPCAPATSPRDERIASPEEPVVGSPSRPPSVERLLAAARPGLGERDHDAVLTVARAVIDDERARLANDGDHGGAARSVTVLADELTARLSIFGRPMGSAPTAVINATGVIVHTNLGRAPWPTAAIEAARAAAAEPLLLEMDRSSGRRGARYRAAEEHLIALTGAEDALITNNNAAALALAVGLAGRGGGVVVSRGELVEIGGGVRIPEIVRRAGARLVEVGTTNRTRAADFAAPSRTGRGSSSGSIPRTSPRPGSSRIRTPRRWPSSLMRPARSSSTISGAGRSWTPRPTDWPTSRPRSSASRPAPTWSRSAATSWSAARRRADRRPGRPHRPAAARSAGPGDPARQDDAGRGRRDARPVPGRAGGPRDPRLADDRRPSGRPPRPS